MSFLSEHSEVYLQSISHPLTNELCNGTLPDQKLYTYLTQDLKYFQVGLRLFGRALSLCDDEAAAIVLAKQIGFIAGDENTYFHETLAELSQTCTSDGNTLPAVVKYNDYMKQLTQSGTYAELVTLLYVMEKVYLGWAELNVNEGKVPENLSPKYQGWIDLHYGDAFSKWVQFLYNEVQRVSNKENSPAMEAVFRTTLQYEVDFFSECYE